MPEEQQKLDELKRILERAETLIEEIGSERFEPWEARWSLMDIQVAVEDCLARWKNQEPGMARHDGSR